MLLETFQLGEPVEHRGIVVTPLFPRRNPVAAYLTLDEALAAGLRVTEATRAGSVPELAVENPLDADVLLYDGEELVGAKQNRILNVTVLVSARSTLAVPVSCVEEGRWAWRSERFAAALHISHAELRRRKAERLQAAPLARGQAQADVWDEVRSKAARMGVTSETAANADTYRHFARDIRVLERAFPLEDGQCGAALSLGGRHCLDAVSRPDAFARLWPKLRSGYLLDALELLDRDPATTAAVERFAGAADAALVTRRPSAGRGDDLRLRGAGVVGGGLELDGELLHLSAFTSAGGSRGGRIARPSRRLTA
jgi:hypothetical protein